MPTPVLDELGALLRGQFGCDLVEEIEDPGSLGVSRIEMVERTIDPISELFGRCRGTSVSGVRRPGPIVSETLCETDRRNQGHSEDQSPERPAASAPTSFTGAFLFSIRFLCHASLLMTIYLSYTTTTLSWFHPEEIFGANRLARRLRADKFPA
jgi:hypothetical protein